MKKERFVKAVITGAFQVLNGLIGLSGTFLRFVVWLSLNLMGPFAKGKEEMEQNVSNAKGIFLKGQGLGLLERIRKNMHPGCRKKFFTNLVISSIIPPRGYIEYEKKYGDRPPYTILISPTMRCNYRCKGCYALDYQKAHDLPIEVVHNVIEQGEKFLSPAFWTILGGEPFIWDGLGEMLEKHPQSYFQVYTNGSLIDEEKARKLQKLGNVFVQISLEGTKEETDKRRGKGAYQRVMKVMDILKKYRVPFGFSIDVTRENVYDVMSDQFLDLMIQKEALMGWYFLSMPIGGGTLDFMPLPEQRLWMKWRRGEIRNTRPIFIVDFWNDAPFVDGCIAGAKGFCHINCFGDVEPCIFIHMAVDNIKKVPLEQALNSDFFRAMRGRQPFNENRYLPCQIIDNPEVLKELYEKHHPYPTHPGYERVITQDHAALLEYAEGVKKLYDSIWKKEKDEWKRKGYLKKKLMF